VTHRTGSVSLVGTPNAGKSTLLNRILGQRLAITSSKPQTTRDRIVGVHDMPGAQLVLVDTPGLHAARSELNRVMVARALSALAAADVALWVVDGVLAARRAEAGRAPLDAAHSHVAGTLADAGRPTVVALNKIDVVPRPLLLPVISALAQTTAGEVVPVSGLTGDGVDVLLGRVAALLPEGQPRFGPDEWTPLSERFLAAEIIREKAFHLTEQEVPYSVAVVVNAFDESERAEGRVRIQADIVVERDSQKGILIGRGAEMLKRIGTAARRDLNALLDARVHLDLLVRVERDWARGARGLRRLGLGDP
jgi:GTP-binding protein Era